MQCTPCSHPLLLPPPHTAPPRKGKGFNRQAFTAALRTYEPAMEDIRQGIQQLVDNECPTCSDGCNGVHSDVNAKLFVCPREREGC